MVSNPQIFYRNFAVWRQNAGARDVTCYIYNDVAENLATYGRLHGSGIGKFQSAGPGTLELNTNVWANGTV